MNRLKILIISVAVLFAFSCNNNTENKENTQNETTIEKAVTNTENTKQESVTEEIIVTENSNNTTIKEAFSYLQKLNITKKISIKYNKDITKIYDETCGKLPKSDPLFVSEGPGTGNTKAMKTKISSSGSNYYVVFSSGPSADPEFIFYKDGELNQAAFSISALDIVIPGNGFIYSSGHTNNMFNKRRKFKVENNKLKEIEQAQYYVGLKTKTLKPIILYKSENLKTNIANLPKDYSIEVLLNKRNTGLFLIKTDFGLTGWVKLENQMYGNHAIDKLFYAGD